MKRPVAQNSVQGLHVGLRVPVKMASSHSFHSRTRFILLQICGIVGLVLVSPINVLWFYLAMKSELWLTTTPSEHSRNVEGIQKRVKFWRTSGDKRMMTTARPGWKSISTAKRDKSAYFKVPVNLGRIVQLETKRRSVTVEPGVMIGQLTRYLHKRGWTIPIVPELDSLSIGGLIAGAGLETSSHKFGMFFDIVQSLEIVLASGELVTCSKDNNADLFYAFAHSYATIGFLTSVTFPIIPSKRYVKIDYRHVSSLTEFHSLMQAEPDHDFVEGLAYSESKILLMFGDMVDNLEPGNGQVNHINRWYKPAFHKHAESVLAKGAPSFVEYLPLIDYYHRHSRAVFWVLTAAYPILNWPVVRFLLGWALPLNTHLQILLPTRVFDYMNEGQVVQDYVIPIERAQEFFETANKLLGIYPVWLCPVKRKNTPAMFGRVEEALDLGYYSYPQADNFHRVRTLKELEQLCIQFQGYQGLYADCFLAGEEFREMFDTTVYDRVRKELDCFDAFPDVYDKVGPKGRHLETQLDSVATV